MRRLTSDENEAMEIARGDFGRDGSPSGNAARYGYRVGFAAGIDYRQAEIEKLIAYIRGQITYSEIEGLL